MRMIRLDNRLAEERVDEYRNPLQVLHSIIAAKFNKGLRIVASVGLTSLAALNTFDFLSTRNDWRASAVVAISFEIMYVAAAWTLRLTPKWRWLSSDAAVLIVGAICSMVYNILNHLNHEIAGLYEPIGWKIFLSIAMSILLAVPALLLMLSVHANNDVHVTQSTLTEDRILGLFGEFENVQSSFDRNTEHVQKLKEAVDLIRAHLKI